jgi:hypothetical protein
MGTLMMTHLQVYSMVLLYYVGPCPSTWRCVGSLTSAQKFNTHQPLIEVHIERLRCLLEKYKKKTLATLGGCVSVIKRGKPRTWLLLWECERTH